MYEIVASNVNSISLLTVAQYNTYNPADADPETWKVPPIKGGGAWWLNNAGEYSRCAYVVSHNESVPYSAVVNGGLKVRPLLSLKSSILNPTGDDPVEVGTVVSFGNTTWVVITGTLVVCEDAIGSSPFRDDWKALDALDYTKSTVKKYCDEWLAYWKG